MKDEEKRREAAQREENMAKMVRDKAVQKEELMRQKQAEKDYQRNIEA